MTKTTLFAAILMSALAGVAEAGGQSGSIGIGAEFLLSGAGGASLNYDGGQWHAGGFLGFADPGPGDATWAVGGRFYYHVHSTAMSDFGVGGGIGIVSVPNMAGDRDSLVFIEPGVQMRVFLAANVALSASTGVVIGTSDAEGVAVTGSAIGAGTLSIGAGSVGLSGGLGLHYYFF